MNTEITANTTYQKIKQLFEGEIIQIQEDLIIEGYITSSDKAGNFFGTLHFQDKKENPTEAFQIDIDLRDYHLRYEIGARVFIRLKGLHLGKSQETYKLGGLFTTAGGVLSVGRLPANLVEKHILVSCDSLAEMSPLEISLDQIQEDMINMLVSIENTEIAPTDLCKSYANQGETSKRIIQDCSQNKIDLINSGFADFQAEQLPTGKGTITGILGFGSGSYSIVIRDTTDISFNDSRCDGSSFECIPPAPNTSFEDLKKSYVDQPLQIKEPVVIEGVITASDDTGNFFKEIYLQDSTAGIKIKINSSKLLENGFEINRVVIVNCEGLWIDNLEGELQLGVLKEGEFTGLEEEELYQFLFLQETRVNVAPSLIELSNLKPEDIGKLIGLSDLQFLYPSSSFVENNTTTKQPLNDCNGNLLEISTLKTASFKDVLIPSGNGIVQGILSFQNNNYLLRIRDMDDLIDLNAARCNVFENSSLTSINTLKSQFQNDTVQIIENLKIKGTVISDSSNRNFKNTELVIQDNEAGITILFNAEHQIPLYAEVEIVVWNGLLKSDSGLLLIDNLRTSHIITVNGGTPPLPILLDMTDVANLAYQSRLVAFNNVQFTIAPDIFTETISITDCENILPVLIDTDASFYNNSVPETNGTIKGILSTNGNPVLRIRSTSDFESLDPYQLCYINDSNEVFISELADPNNNADARFVELFNAGEVDVLLDGWKLLRYTNENIEVSSQIDLSGYRIKGGETFIISPNATVFEAVYGFIPDVAASSNSPADSNGDDNLVLLNSQNEIIDIFGIIGEDGSGTNHEFEDGRAYRKLTVVKGNVSYSFQEWDIYNDTGANGTVNQPQNAPEDFSPGVR
ncbi:DUF5689 domain-containing protein [Ascidiimonas sp. W6]|uniref:DUF5689 domain-containing protein n=1 Tax=Ascidiimonas meishanensis TaxID=3128903 RepID=UPI0030EE158C